MAPARRTSAGSGDLEPVRAGRTRQLPAALPQHASAIKSDADLWAACIGGAEQVDSYTLLVEAAGFAVEDVRANDVYEFVSERAENACDAYGVKSNTLRAIR